MNRIDTYKFLGITLFLALFSFWSYGQDKISFEASTDAKQVVLGGYFEVTFTLSNAKGSNFKPPKFSGFRVLSGPNTSSSVTIVNGNLNSSSSYGYYIQTLKEGEFTIGPASVKANGRTYKSKTLTIQVVKGKSISASPGKGSSGTAAQAIFIKAIPNTEQARIGQQVTLDYKLFTTVSVDNYNILAESEYPGFYAQRIRYFNNRLVREVVDGVQYNTKVLKRITLFPQQGGELTIDPMVMRLGVVAQKSKNPLGFPFALPSEFVNVQTEPIVIQVMPLPEPAPSSFGGAVGQYRMTSTIDRTSLTTDDAVTIKISLFGNGDIKRVQPPLVHFPDTFEVYDPRAIEEKAFEREGQIVGQKTYEYLAVPKAPGVYPVNFEFTYFDVDSARYVTLTGEALQLAVTKGTATTSIKSPVITKPEGDEIRFIKLDSKFRSELYFFYRTPLFWVLILLPIIGFIGVLIYKRYLNHIQSLDPHLLNRRQARKIAKKYFRQSEVFLKEKQTNPFYDSISRALLSYVCNKLDIPYSELSEESVREKLTGLKVKEPLIQDFMSLIHECERALYAGVSEGHKLEDTYKKALGTLTAIEGELRG